MNRWYTQFRFECRILLKQYIGWLWPLLSGVWFAWGYVSAFYSIPGDIYSYTFLTGDYPIVFIIHTLTVGLAFMLGMMLIRRDWLQPVYEWQRSLPVSAASVITAKFAAGLAYLSLYTLILCAVFVGFGYSEGLPGAFLLSSAAQFAVRLQWSHGASLALAMLLASALPRRYSYLIGFCAWIFGTLFIDVFLITRYSLYYLKTFHLSQIFIFHSITENEVWAAAFTPHLWYSRIFVLAFTVLLLTATITIWRRHTPSRSQQAWIAASFAGLLLVTASFIPYGQFWADRYAAHSQIMSDAASSESNGPFTVFPVDQYDLEIQRDDSDILHVIASIDFPTTAPNAQGMLPFTLNRAFHPDRIRFNGRDIEALRQGDRLLIPLADGDLLLPRQQLEIAYTGRIAQWGYNGSADKVTAFVQDQSVFLPSYAGWYPLPGDEPIFVQDHPQQVQLNVSRRSPGPASFDIRLSGFSNKLYGTIPEIASIDRDDNPDPSPLSASDAPYRDIDLKELYSHENSESLQRFQSNGADGLTLFAGNLIEVALPGEETYIVTSPLNRTASVAFLQELSEARRYFDSWLAEPLSPIRQIAYLPMDSVQANGGAGFEWIEGNTHFISKHRYYYIHGRFASALNSMLFYDLGSNYSYMEETERPTSLISEIRNSFYHLYIREHPEASEHRIVREGLIQPYLNNGSLHQLELFHQIDGAIQGGQTELVKEVLNQLRTNGLRMDIKRTPYAWYSNKPPNYPVLSEGDWQSMWRRYGLTEQEKGGFHD